MPLRKVLKDFKGSPDGCQVIHYTAGQIVEIVPSLAEVSDAEGWTEPHAEEGELPLATESAAPAEKPKRPRAKKTD